MPHPLVSQLYFTRSEFQHWYHTSENMAIWQSLKNDGLQDFVGNIDDEAPCHQNKKSTNYANLYKLKRTIRVIRVIRG